MTRETAITLVQRVIDIEYDEDETARVLNRLDRALACPAGYVSDLIFWPEDGKEPTAAKVVDQALAYQPFAL
ncbi:e9imm peptide [Streptomyces sp. NBC_00525]|uniref:e9imm peptide n=1 Tax=Streptomyces sp. NBC_00525 TaxID=2903660 RepID=UPI002E80F068|nr:e9imm peptide [Streptomyces sp. NBC_00525]WUC98097.1 e9imm peptide [Streptomyces sp. NBC_00525]